MRRASVSLYRSNRQGGPIDLGAAAGGAAFRLGGSFAAPGRRGVAFSPTEGSFAQRSGGSDAGSCVLGDDALSDQADAAAMMSNTKRELTARSIMKEMNHYQFTVAHYQRIHRAIQYSIYMLQGPPMGLRRHTNQRNDEKSPIIPSAAMVFRGREPEPQTLLSMLHVFFSRYGFDRTVAKLHRSDMLPPRRSRALALITESQTIKRYNKSNSTGVSSTTTTRSSSGDGAVSNHHQQHSLVALVHERQSLFPQLDLPRRLREAGDRISGGVLFDAQGSAWRTDALLYTDTLSSHAHHDHHSNHGDETDTYSIPHSHKFPFLTVEKDGCHIQFATLERSIERLILEETDVPLPPHPQPLELNYTNTFMACWHLFVCPDVLLTRLTRLFKTISVHSSLINPRENIFSWHLRILTVLQCCLTNASIDFSRQTLERVLSFTMSLLPLGGLGNEAHMTAFPDSLSPAKRIEYMADSLCRSLQKKLEVSDRQAMHRRFRRDPAFLAASSDTNDASATSHPKIVMSHDERLQRRFFGLKPGALPSQFYFQHNKRNGTPQVWADFSRSRRHGQNPAPAPAPLYALGFDEPVLFQRCSDIDLAQQLSLITFDYLTSIRPREWCHNAWDDPLLSHASRNLTAMIHHLDAVSSWIACLIATPATLQERRYTYAKCIRLAHFLFEMQNYAAAEAVMKGVDHTDIMALRETCDPRALPSDLERATLSQLRDAFDVFTGALAKGTPWNLLTPCVPLLGPMLSEMNHAQETWNSVEKRSFLLPEDASVAESAGVYSQSSPVDGMRYNDYFSVRYSFHAVEKQPSQQEQPPKSRGIYEEDESSTSTEAPQKQHPLVHGWITTEFVNWRKMRACAKVLLRLISSQRVPYDYPIKEDVRSLLLSMPLRRNAGPLQRLCADRASEETRKKRRVL